MKDLIRITLLFILGLFYTPILYSQVDSTQIVFNQYIKKIQDFKRIQHTQTLITNSAKFFIGTPYVAHTLDKNEKEVLVTNLKELDCMTFVETVIALTRMVQSKDLTFNRFADELKNVRYRKNTIIDYTDRMHYMSDWIYENTKKGYVKDISHQIGGSLWNNHVDFITTHTESYSQLSKNPEFIKKITETEQNINNRTYYYIPEEELPLLEKKIHNGDIIGFVTNIKGLDISHDAFAYWKNNKLTFIHASSLAKKVIINKESLYEYLINSKHNIGIVVVRTIPFH